jgi:ubiquinone/menaquinone biosynthesis C-methylase UbiE
MALNKKLAEILQKNSFARDEEGIYLSPLWNTSGDQDNERKLREAVAHAEYDNYLAAISRSHSVPVMDIEVERFLSSIPKDGIILDIGGCWGWHWRKIAAKRPDVSVLIMDFIHANLHHARNVLGSLLETQVALLHADATALPFPDAVAGVRDGFDGIWTVQVFQHIPDFRKACTEAFRVLNDGGNFANYSLHITPLSRMIFKLFGKKYHVDGVLEDRFYLKRANDEQEEIIRQIFGNVKSRYTEGLFHPDLKLFFSAKAGSLLGRVDAWLGNFPFFTKLIARQRSFHAVKTTGNKQAH